MPSPFRHALVACDGSEASRLALGYALALAREGTSLTLLHAVDEGPLVAQSSTTVTAFDPGPLMAALDEQGKAILEDAAARCRAAGIEVATVLAHDAPVPAIGDALADCGCDLAVVGTHGAGALERALIGSTASGVLRRAEVPVLVVHPGSIPAGDSVFRRALVALDASDAARAAAALSARFAASLGSAVIVAHVAAASGAAENDRAAVEEAARAAGVPTSAEFDFSTGNVVERLLDAVRRCSADCILIGTHGRRGVARLVLGSVAEAVARATSVPAFVVRG